MQPSISVAIDALFLDEQREDELVLLGTLVLPGESGVSCLLEEANRAPCEWSFEWACIVLGSEDTGIYGLYARRKASSV